jgi:hypothetical protein
MPVYDCGVPDCSECQRAFGPDRTAAIADYQAKLSKPVQMCGCGKVLENPAAYAAHCTEAPSHFTRT